MNLAFAKAFEGQLIEQSRDVINKWRPVLEAENHTVKPITDAVQQYIVANVLETASKRVKADGGSDWMSEAVQTSTGVVGSTYQKQILGMIRQTYEQMIASEIASVQPISVPSAMGYTLKQLRDDGSDPADHTNWGSSVPYADHTTGENTAIQKGMTLSIGTFNVALDTPKKLKIEHTVELEQDLSATHGLSAASLLSAAATQEIAREIDGMLVQKAYAAATAHKTVTFGKVAPSGKGYTERSWFQSGFGEAVLQAAESVYTDSGLEADIMILGTRASTFVSSLNDFRPSKTFDRSQGGTWGLERQGTTEDGRFRMFRSRYVPTNEILVFRKGTSILDGGLFYLPYIALYLGQPTTNQSTLKVERAFMSRFATYTASNKYFARIVIDDAATGIA